MHTSTRRRVVAAVVTAVAAVSAGVAGTSQASADDTFVISSNASLRYVAMGDSYSAASGVLPPDPQADPRCLRSTANYAHLIADETAATLTDVTCGGAQTKDYFSPQYDGVPPQLQALRKDTELVTMTIGGNDNNTFIGAIVACGTAGVTTAGQGSPCKDQYGGSFAHDIRTKTYPALVRTLKAVHRRAPHAQVAILGYPWILPEKVGCFEKLPVAEGDVPYLHGIQALLNRVVHRAADETGSTYVNLDKASEGHDACQDIGTRWVEPVVTTTNPVVVHPNTLGESRMAARAMRVLGLR